MDDKLELEELRVIAPAPMVRPLPAERMASHKEAVLDEVSGSFDGPPSHELIVVGDRSKRRRRRPLKLAMIAAAAAALLSATAAGWAWVSSSPARDTVSVECVVAGSDAIIPSASGNPVTDCAAEWQRETGAQAPPLVAYDNGLGSISVLPASQQPPAGYTALPQGETQKIALVEMQQWLDDYVAGLNSDCFDNATAVAMTQNELTAVGLGDWTVHSAPASDFSQGQVCVDTGILNPGEGDKSVDLRALGGADPQDAPFEQLAVKIRSITQACAPVDVVTRQVRGAAAALGLSEDANDYQLTEVNDPSAKCTTVTENVGGTIFLTVRGPAS
jgi:hypothetical protein